MSSSGSALPASDSSFMFDGSSSDMAQQFYNLHQAGYSNASALNLASIPTDLQARLDNHSLSFTDLSPLLQRAVLWDTGYVAVNGDSTTLSTIYTSCTSPKTMAEIALSRAIYKSAGCTVQSCSDLGTYRSNTCTGTQMANVSLCAASNVAISLNASMWATGGGSSMLPEPNMIRHVWTESENNYLILAIHMVESEVTWGNCPSSTAQSAMIIPCVPYDSTTDMTCRPSAGQLVDSWLADSSGPSPTNRSSSKTGLIIGICAGVVLVLGLFAGLWVCARRKRLQKARETSLETYRSATTPNPVNRSSMAPTPATPPLAAVANGLWVDPVITIFRIPLEKVLVGQLVSQGGYGEVYRGTYKDQSVAVKKLMPAIRNDMKQINSFLAEAKIMASIEHERLVPFVGVAWDSLRDLCVLTEFMEGGDLRSLLKQFNEDKRRSRGFDADKIKIAMHVAHALTYLHSLKPIVIHRDIKSRNILLDNEWNAKLTDFGVSRETSDQTMTAGVGSTLWMAPEVMMGERYNEKADIFSFGVVLTELDSHQMPYANAKSTNSGRTLPDTAILQQVAMGRLQAQFSDKTPWWLRELGSACLSLNSKARPSAAELLYALQTKW